MTRPATPPNAQPFPNPASPSQPPQSELIADSKRDAITQFLRDFFSEGGTTEIRVLDHRAPDGEVYGLYGYFSDQNFEAAAKLALRYSGKSFGVYFTPNPVGLGGVHGNLNAMLAYGKLLKASKGKSTTDEMIVERRWLFIDIDPTRAPEFKKDSATDFERHAASKTAEAIRNYLSGKGIFPRWVINSGNGFHLYYRLGVLPELPSGDDAIRSILNGLANRFDSPGAKVGREVFNPARIARLPGTQACKGEPSPERPHRTASVIEHNADAELLDADQIIRLIRELDPAALKPGDRKSGDRKSAQSSSKGSKPGDRNGRTSDPGSDRGGDRASDRKSRYGRGCLQSACEKIRTAPDGTRNTTLNSEAFQIYQLVAGGVLEGATADEELIAAASAVGLENEEIHKTLDSARTRGMKEPRGVPETFADGELPHNPEKKKKGPKTPVSPKPVLTEPPGNPPAADGSPDGSNPSPGQPKTQLVINSGNKDEVLTTALKIIGESEPTLFIRNGQMLIIEDCNELEDETFRLAKATYRKIDVVVDKYIDLYQQVASDDRVLFIEIDKFTQLRNEFARSLMEATNRSKFLRELRDLVSTPRFFPGGEIPQSPGYYPARALLYSPRCNYPAVPDHPTQADAVAAANRLLHLVQDFEFDCNASKSAWLAFVLTLVSKEYINEPTPATLIEANRPGPGKSLLASIAHIIATGRDPDMAILPEDEAERRKTLSTFTLSKRRVVIFDNVNCQIGGQALESFITGARSTQRQLATFDERSEASSAVTALTANHAVVTDDMRRRSVIVKLCTDSERPELRTGFAIPRLADHVKQHHPELLTGCLTILRAFHQANQPRHGKEELGSFYAWDRLIRGCIHWLGLADPCEARTTSQVAWAREEEGYWRDLLAALHALIPESSPARISDLLDTIRRETDGNIDARPNHHAVIARKMICVILDAHDFGRVTPKQVAKVFGKKLDMRIGRFCLRNRQDRKGFNIWFSHEFEPEEQTEIDLDLG